MDSKVLFKTIYGCPKHGINYGKFVNYLKLKKTIKKSCFICYKCKKAYVDATNINKGYLNKEVFFQNMKFKLWNTNGPIPLPRKVYIYNKSINKSLCECDIPLKEKMKEVTHLLLKNGKTYSMPAKICLFCNKVFISNKIYYNNEVIKFLELNKIQVKELNKIFKGKIHATGSNNIQIKEPNKIQQVNKSKDNKKSVNYYSRKVKLP